MGLEISSKVQWVNLVENYCTTNNISFDQILDKYTQSIGEPLPFERNQSNRAGLSSPNADVNSDSGNQDGFAQNKITETSPSTEIEAMSEIKELLKILSLEGQARVRK